eukprot:10684399-Lingulodinium_polyedra.AAC.1
MSPRHLAMMGTREPRNVVRTSPCPGRLGRSRRAAPTGRRPRVPGGRGTPPVAREARRPWGRRARPCLRDQL